MGLLSRGITPESPPLFDANALGQIFETKGIFFGLVGVIFFIIPVLLTSIKLIVDKNKFIGEIMKGKVKNGVNLKTIQDLRKLNKYYESEFDVNEYAEFIKEALQSQDTQIKHEIEKLVKESKI